MLVTNKEAQDILHRHMSKSVGSQSGQSFEDVIQEILYRFPNIAIQRNVPAMGRIGGSFKTEFVISSQKVAATRIECKYQGVDGSVYSKILEFVINLSNVPEKQAIIVVEGDVLRKIGNKPNRTVEDCRTYAENELKNSPTKVSVMWYDEFVQWCNDNLG